MSVLPPWVHLRFQKIFVPLPPMLHPGDQENEGEPEAIHRQTVRRRDLVGLLISPSLKPMIHETDNMKNAQKSLDF